LPACCRARGKHKCFLRLTREGGSASTSGEPAVSHVSERCPYNPTWTNAAHRLKPIRSNHDRQARSPTEAAISLETKCFD
jgi:hypothetical protein